MSCLLPPCSLSLLRVQSSYWPILCGANISQLRNLKLQKLYIQAIPKKNASQFHLEDVSNEKIADEASKKTQRVPRRSRKKMTEETPEEDSISMVNNANEEDTASKKTKQAPRRRKKKMTEKTLEEDSIAMADNVKKEDKIITAASTEDSEKVTRKGKKKATALPSSIEASGEKKVAKSRGRKKVGTKKDQTMSGELSDLEESTFLKVSGNKMEELQLGEDEGEDISFTYSWPPLVCCFGAAQHAFVPSGRPANRLIDHEIHESMKEMFWSPTKFVRAPGGSSSSVALALASMGGRVAFMGKVGDDEYGQGMLYQLNFNNVQTRSIVIDSSRRTAVSRMKIARRGGIRSNCVKPSAEDSFFSSEINIDVLKEAKMFYFNSSSLLDQNMRSTTMQAVKAAKQLGEVIFFDLNLPLPLWKTRDETKAFIQQAWSSADFIEVTKQELEFLCGIEPTEKFDTKDNDKSKFVHYKPKITKKLWHENLKVLFVTNGTSKIHYYTENDDGWVRGTEDAPITPFTGDMSVSGDAIVAALMRMLTVNLHLSTDKSYLECMIKYAIGCGVTDQWSLARIHGFPPKEGMEEDETSEVEDEEVDGSLSYEVSAPRRSITEKEYRTHRRVRSTVTEPMMEPVG